MTSQAFRHGAAQTAQTLALAPVLLAALIGAVPLIIPCIACRCCRDVYARIIKLIAR